MYNYLAESNPKIVTLLVRWRLYISVELVYCSVKCLVCQGRAEGRKGHEAFGRFRPSRSQSDGLTESTRLAHLRAAYF